ncbi:MAG: DNA-binding protein WhiA [Clostridia bacterium]|nr:DNA-binding protein WhiA [Clostridia bacterium]
MSFSANVKDELCRMPLGKNCCMLSELTALYRTSGSLSFHGMGRVQVQYRVENAALARRIFRLLRSRMNITPRLHYVQHARLGGQRTCVLTIGDEDSQRLMLALRMVEQDEDGEIRYRRTTVRYPMTRQCCRKAYLRAAYLGGGTMTTPDKDYHFEIATTDQSMVKELSRLLDKSDLPVNTYTRKGATVVYLKSAQHISDALAMMGASNSVFALEDVRIRKQARGAANRAINCDGHNLERTVAAADEQVQGIRRYVIEKGLRSLPPALQEIAQKRLDNVDLSLVELGQLFEPPLSKSAVNHRMRRLMDVVRALEADAEADEARHIADTQEE